MYQFTVAASGTSPLSYTWYIDNIIVPDSDELTFAVPTNSTIEVTVQVTNNNTAGVSFSDTNSLMIHPLTCRGEYTN